MQSAFSWNLYLVPSIVALLLGIGEVALPVIGLTAYSEVEGLVRSRVSLTVSIHVQMTVLLFFAVNKSVVDWLTSNYGL